LGQLEPDAVCSGEGSAGHGSPVPPDEAPVADLCMDNVDSGRH
jgi:hypothetical protein